MGGKRFKAHETLRLPADVARALEADIISRLANVGVNAVSIPTFADKPDFGDLDILVAEEDLLALAGAPSEIETPAHQGRKSLMPVLGALAMARDGANDHATSYVIPTAHGNFQVDLIAHPRAILANAARFYAWGDLGALVSMTARRMSLSNKATGLYLRSGPWNEQFQILLLTDYDAALELTGFDSARHARGFATREDVYPWIASGRFFDPQAYLLENMSHASRARAKHRPMQTAFRQWMLEEGVPANATMVVFNDPDGGTTAREAHDERMRQRIRDLFPHVVNLEREQAEQVALHKETKKLRQIAVAPEVIGRKTGLSDKELNNFIWRMTKHARFNELKENPSEELQDIVIADTQAILKEKP